MNGVATASSTGRSLETASAAGGGRSEAIDLGSCTVNARSLNGELAQYREREATARGVLEGRVRALVEHVATVAEPKLLNLQSQLEVAREAAAEAYPCESPIWSTCQVRLERQISSLAREIQAVREGENLVQRALRKVEGRVASNSEFLGRVLASFPGAQKLDLSCLTEMKDDRKLPKVWLFSLDHNTTHFFVTAPSQTERFPVLCPQALIQGSCELRRANDDTASTILNNYLLASERASLAIDVAAACNVYLRGVNRLQYEHGKAIAERAARFGWPGARPEHGPWIGSIELLAAFSDMGKVIPKDARTIIERARQSGLFEDVVLLCDSPSWEVRYHGVVPHSVFIPRIKGKLVGYSDDPLIVGLAKLPSGARMPIVLGRFDVTPAERYIEEEFCTRL